MSTFSTFYWPFVRGIHRWLDFFMFSLICAWANHLNAGDLRRRCNGRGQDYVVTRARWYACTVQWSYYGIKDLILLYLQMLSIRCYWTGTGLFAYNHAWVPKSIPWAMAYSPDHLKNTYSWLFCLFHNRIQWTTGLISGLRPDNGRCRYRVTPSRIVWAQT